MAGQRAVLYVVARRKPVILRNRDTTEVCFTKWNQDAFHRPVPVNPLDYTPDQSPLHICSVVDHPECQLGAVDLNATFDVDTAKAAGTIGAKNRVSECFMTNKLVVVTTKIGAVKLQGKIVRRPIAPPKFLTQPGSAGHQRLKIQLSVFFTQRFQAESTVLQWLGHGSNRLPSRALFGSLCHVLNSCWHGAIFCNTASRLPSPGSPRQIHGTQLTAVKLPPVRHLAKKKRCRTAGNAGLRQPLRIQQQPEIESPASGPVVMGSLTSVNDVKLGLAPSMKRRVTPSSLQPR